MNFEGIECKETLDLDDFHFNQKKMYKKRKKCVIENAKKIDCEGYIKKISITDHKNEDINKAKMKHGTESPVLFESN